MPVHTMEVLRTMNSKSIRQFTTHQTWFTAQALKDLLFGCVAEIKSNRYPYNGVREAVLRRSPTSTSHFFLSLILNLQSLQLGRFSIDLFNCARLPMANLHSRFGRALQSLSPGMNHPGLAHWSVQQVHYALDIQTPNVPEYVLLFNRVRLPDSFTAPLQSSGSFYTVSTSGAVTLNFYDKADQLLNEGRFWGQKRLVKQVQDRLRIEVQCRGDKLHHIRRIAVAMGLPDHKLSPGSFLNAALSNMIIQNYYKQTIGYSDFHSLAQAQSLVQAGPGRKDRKIKLSQFLQLLDQRQTVSDAVKDYVVGTTLASSATTIQGSQRSLKTYLNDYLPKLNINPVLIPASMSHAYLPNPMPVADRIP